MRRSLISSLAILVGCVTTVAYGQTTQTQSTNQLRNGSQSGIVRELPGKTGNAAYGATFRSVAQPTATGVSTSLGDSAAIVQEAGAAQQDVPSAPADANGQQQVGPALQVQSNAATSPDWAYERNRGRLGQFINDCNPGEPFRLFGTTRWGTDVGGWLQSGFHTDDNGLFNNHDDRMRLHQAWLYAEHKAQQGCGWDFGYRSDLVYGVDGIDLQARGNPPIGAPDNWDNDFDHGIFGWAAPQAYVEAARGRFNVIGGKFFSPLGYESLMAPERFFYSHTFTRYFTQPFTMTGALTRFDLSNDLQLVNGVTAGWETGFDQVNSGFTYVGGFRYHPCSPINFSYLISAGNSGYLGEGSVHNFILDLMLTDKMNYVSEFNYLDLDNNQDTSWVNYWLYQLNPCFGLGTRFEWYRSDRFTGVDNSTYSLTTGLRVQKWANLIWRPEVRMDWGAGAVNPGKAILGSSLIFTF